MLTIFDALPVWIISIVITITGVIAYRQSIISDLHLVLLTLIAGLFIVLITAVQVRREEKK